MERCRSISKNTVSFKIKEQKEMNAIVTNLAKQKFCLDVLIQGKNNVHNSQCCKFHKLNTALTGKDFLKITVQDYNLQKMLFDKVLITTPEVSLLQLTKTFPFHRLMLLALELCGSYALDLSSETGFVSAVAPALSNKRLFETQEAFARCRLGKTEMFKTLANYVVQGSASPAESKLFTFLCGPRKYGFFQVKKFDLNKEIKLSKEAALLCGFSKIRPDLSCEEEKIAIEYDSKTFHEKVERNQNDKARTLALQHDGWKTITIVPKEIADYESLAAIARDILRAMRQDCRVKGRNFEKNSRLVFDDFWTAFSDKL